jgi:hypothetical protein
MPKTNYKPTPEVISVLLSYVMGDIDEDDVSAEIDSLAFYQSDVREGVNTYFAGIA